MTQHDLPSSPMASSRPPHMAGDVGPSVLDLWLRPARFFKQLGEDRPKALVIAASILAGISHTQDRMDSQLAKASMGRASHVFDSINSWGAYWGISLLLGATVSAGLVWISYGWWYRVRLGWSGVPTADITRTRDVAVLSSIVSGVPALLYGVYQMATYDNPLAAAAGDDAWGLALVLFVFWGVWVSYTGATTLFPVKRGRARFYFLVGPIIFYVLVLGVLGLALALVGGAGN